MLFNSFEFALFLPVTFMLYWALERNLMLQNALLLLASYLFYAWWDWRFLTLIVASSLTDYIVGGALHRAEGQKKRQLLLAVSLVINLGCLGFFKYYNFFVESLVELFQSIGVPAHTWSIQLILPVGISFYTFQTLSYTIDIYRRELKPAKSLLNFLAFVSFFPQLVAGPIERAKSLLGQFETRRTFNYDQAKDGLRQILWGLFKKVVVADSCAREVDRIFANHEAFSGSTLVVALVYFAFQIYGDFSGYSDIAIGTGRLFGFRLMRNFAFPYFSRNIPEFWQRWHISLSSWFRDYVYVPLGGSRVSTPKRIRNVVLTFSISGLWHGANWTFLFWGFLNSMFYVPSMLRGRTRPSSELVAAGRRMPSLKELIQLTTTFALTLIAWTFFRADNMGSALAYLRGMWSLTTFSRPTLNMGPLVFVGVLVGVEWVQRDKQHGLETDEVPRVLRWALYWLLSLLILAYFENKRSFIYFQF